MGNAHAVLNHQRRKASAVNKDNAFCDLGRELSRLACEARCGNEDAFPGTPPGERAIECLDLRSADRALPAFRLNADPLESELVERNYAVDAPVTGAAHLLKIVLARAVAQGVQ